MDPDPCYFLDPNSVKLIRIRTNPDPQHWCRQIKKCWPMMNLGCESQPFSNIADFEGSTAVKKSNFATFREEFNMTEHITRWGFDSWRFKKLLQRLLERNLATQFSQPKCLQKSNYKKINSIKLRVVDMISYYRTYVYFCTFAKIEFLKKIDK